MAWLAGACSGGEQRTDAAQPDSAPPAVAESLPPMPAVPEAGAGRLAAISAGGAEPIAGEWPAEAGTCEHPPMLQLVAQDPGKGGTILLLALPAGNPVVRYPVAIVSAGLPTPPAAQVGVNLFRPTGTYSYQAAEGMVDLSSLGRVVSGRFTVTLREINSNKRVQYAGGFREVAVKPLAPAVCAAADSVAHAPSTR